MAPEVQVLIQAAKQAHQSGRLDEAESLCHQVLEAVPEDSEANLLMGVTCVKAGRYEKGIEALKRVRGIDGRAIHALKWTSIAQRGSGRFEEAVTSAQRAYEMGPNDPDAASTLAMAYMPLRKYREAIAFFQAAISRRPHAGDSYGLAMALKAVGARAEALEMLGTATRMDPNPTGLVWLAELAMDLGSAHEAEAAAREALRLDPNFAKAHLLLAEGLIAEESDEEAMAHLDRAEALDPSLKGVDTVRARRLQAQGRFEEATAVFEKALAARPDQGMLYYGLISTKRITEEDRPLVERVEQALQSVSFGNDEQSAVQFALGKAYDDLGEYQRALGHYDEANRLGRSVPQAGLLFDQKEFSARADRWIRLFTSQFFTDSGSVGIDSDLPIFIVGMPRSGTTLLDQILTCHPEIGAAGEQGFWLSQEARLVDYNKGLVDGAGVGSAVRHYCSLLEQIAPGVRHVTDKNPANFLILGLIHVALPKAKIIHVQRNLIDTALSIYTTPMRTPPEFASNRDDIVFAMQEYAREMAHWREVLPTDQFLEISYERMVKDREQVTRQVLEFCGLEWDEACAHPEKNRRVVNTPSFWQVRQPIYTSSVDRWKRYEPWLGAFSKLL